MREWGFGKANAVAALISCRCHCRCRCRCRCLYRIPNPQSPIPNPHSPLFHPVYPGTLQPQTLIHVHYLRLVVGQPLATADGGRGAIEEGGTRYVLLHADALRVNKKSE